MYEGIENREENDFESSDTETTKQYRRRNIKKRNPKRIKAEKYQENTETSDSESTDAETKRRPSKRRRSTKVPKRTGLGPLLYQCPKCDKFFSYRDGDCDRTSHQCPYCKVKIPHLVDVNTKLKSKKKHNNTEDRHECTVCTTVFKEKWRLF